MKVAILAGGFGTRLSEETSYLPKPMIQIGEQPILWHIMKIYSHYGFNDFVILGGYKCYSIKEYFANYFLHQSDVTFDIKHNSIEIINNKAEPWRVTVLDTGIQTLTGGRILKAQKYLENDSFFLTYGDGVSNVNLPQLLQFHKSHKKAITMTAVQPDGRFGAMEINEPTDKVDRFIEKPKGDGGWINGGFFVCEPKIFNYITEGDHTVWELRPLQNLAKDNELYAYKHNDFWKPMDTLRDKLLLEELWNKNIAPWKIWN
jgi:glucose-1-phosphate cytidylyltransferase